MGTTNHGTQEITYEYFEEATAEDFNRRHLDIQPRGIYKGGYLTKVTNSKITLSTFTVEIGDNNEQVSVKTAAIATLEGGGPGADKLDSGSISSSTPYIVLRWAFVEQQNNYVEVHAITNLTAAGGLQDNDIVVGKCDFSGGPLSEDFIYIDRTFLNVQDLFFKVETSTGLYVQLRAGRIQDGTQCITVPEERVGLFSVPSAPNSRIDLVYVDTDGTVKIKQGVQAVSPTAPDYESKLVVAEVKIVNGDVSIPDSRITDVRSFITKPVESFFGTRTKKDSLGNTLVENAVYKVTGDGYITAYTSSVAGQPVDLHLYNNFSNPPTGTLFASSKCGAVYGEDPRQSLSGVPVIKNTYWKIVQSGGSIPTIFWTPIGSSQCVKQ